MKSEFTESVVEITALTGLQGLGYMLLPKLISGELRVKDA